MRCQVYRIELFTEITVNQNNGQDRYGAYNDRGTDNHRSPGHVPITEILHQKNHGSTQIAERIGKVYQEDGGTYHFQGSNQPFDQISKGDISHIKSQAGKDHPGNGRYVSPNIKQGGKYHQHSPKQGYHIDDIQGKPVIADKDYERHEQKHKKGYGNLCLGKNESTVHMKLAPNVGSERITKFTKDCQRTVKKNQKADTTEKTTEKKTTFRTVHRKTLRAELDIHCSGSGHLIQKVDTQKHERKADSTGYKRHPILGDGKSVEDELPHSLDKTRRDNQRDTQAHIQHLTDTPTLNVTEQNTPNHTEGKTAQKNRKNFQIRRQNGKTQKRKLGKAHHTDDIINALVGLHSGKQTNAYELGQCITNYLEKDIKNLDVKAPQCFTGIQTDCERFAKGIGTGINQKYQNTGIQGQNIKRRTGKVTLKHQNYISK